MKRFMIRKQRIFSSIFFYIFAFIGFHSFPSAASALNTLVEGKAAFFLPTDNKFQKIYGSVGGIYGAEATFQIWHNLYAWGSVDYFSKEGRSIGEHDPTKITIVPAVLGLKYFFPINDVDLYVGAGLVGAYLGMHDNSPLIINDDTSKGGVGGIAKTGIIFNINTNFFIDLFVNYTYMKINFNGNDQIVILSDANISGFSAGFAFGYRFGDVYK